jgi:hypothetical protein
MNSDIIIRLEEEYFGADSAEQCFLDFEVYYKNEDIILQHHIESDVNNILIKKLIRWKMKQLNTLKHLPYFELEEERKKKVRLKHERLRRIDDFELLIFNSSNSTQNIFEAVTARKKKGGMIDLFEIATDNFLAQDYD